MNSLLTKTNKEIEQVRKLIKKSKTREETETHIQHLEELLILLDNQQKRTLEKTYLVHNQEKL